MNIPLQHILTEALEDEYKARAMYRKVIARFGPVRPFVNIVEAEEKHIAALIPLFKQNDIPIPEDNWDSQLQAPDTLLEACQAGVDAEIENMDMYERLLKANQDADVAFVLSNLQVASRDNHLPAFQRCLEHRGGRGQKEHRGKNGWPERGRHGE